MTDFTTIIGTVKTARRTERFVILAALYSLGAAKVPVPVKEINDVLRLNLRKAAPPRVSSRLPSFTPDVRIGKKGPPLQWLLTEKGLTRLREETGLPLPVERDDDSFGADVGIVCALEHPEFSAVMTAFGGAAKWKEIGDARYTHVYRETELRTDGGKVLRVVGTTSTSMGLTAASIVTTQLVYQFRPRIVVMIGIAAGTRDGDKQFGDVLVADPSVDYNSGKVVLADGIRDFLPDPYPVSLNPRLRSILHKYSRTHEVFAQMRAGWSGPVPGAANRLHVGPLGAADQVIDDPTRIGEIQRNWRKLIGLEMETYGVYRACSEAPDPKPRFVSFKAVCDFAANKSDSWQAYAAYTAAEFAVRFLKAEWDALWPARG